MVVMGRIRNRYHGSDHSWDCRC